VRAAEELRYLVLAAQREGNRMLARELRPLGITPSQAEVIRVLDDHQPLTLNGLGELLVCETGTNPSRLVDRLVTAGTVARKPSEQDRREVEITLTPQGRELAARIATIEDRLYSWLDAAAGRDPDGVLAVLRSLVADLPAGLALARRTALQHEASAARGTRASWRKTS
jgi:DNA-binding MarR family transcriptional regulator